MKHRVQIGGIYWHRCEGVWWRVRVTSIDKPIDKNQRTIWNGELISKNSVRPDMEIGMPIWGYVNELREQGEI